MCAEEARSRVLAFFDAPVTEYTVVFTHNATGALKLVGEAFPFGRDSTFVLGTDSHNSVNGIRQFALAKGALLAYISSTLVGGVDEAEAKVSKFLFQQGLPLIISRRASCWPTGPGREGLVHRACSH